MLLLNQRTNKVFGVCELDGLTLYLTGKAWAHRESDDGIEKNSQILRPVEEILGSGHK